MSSLTDTLMAPEPAEIARPKQDQFPRLSDSIDDSKEENGQDLPEDVRKEIFALVRRYESAYDHARREYVRKVLKAREFTNGRQYLVFDSQTGMLRVPTQPKSGQPVGVDDKVYVANIYQAFMLSLDAIASANAPTSLYVPGSSRKPGDVRAATTADATLRLFDQNNDIQSQVREEVFYLWNDGTYGSYIRHVQDGDRFGYTNVPIHKPFAQKSGEDTFNCPCGEVTPASLSIGACPRCAEPHGPDALQRAPTVMGIKQVGMDKVPNGQERRDVVGGLELKLHPTARAQWQFPVLTWSIEVDRALLMGTYPTIANKLRSTGSGQASTDNSYERRARLINALGTTVDNARVTRGLAEDSITFKRTWIRKWAFGSIESQRIRDYLVDRYPDGMLFAAAGEEMCEARHENMDDRWRVAHAMVGPGQIREPIGGSLIQLQEIFNDLLNLERDLAEYTIPIYGVDVDLVNYRSIIRNRVRPGTLLPIKGVKGKTVQQAFTQTQPGAGSQAIGKLRDEIGGNLAQFQTGLFPASFGGNTGANDTAHGIAIERDQAMGRIGIWWRVIKAHRADYAPLVVKAFKDSRTDPVNFTEVTGGGKFNDTTIDPADLEAGVFQVRPQTAEDFPVTWPQRKGIVMSLLQNPAFQPVFTNLSNVDDFKRDVGIPSYEFPGEAGWKQQMNETDLLLAGQPLTDPMGGPPQPSLPINQLMDDHVAHLNAGKAYAATDEGQKRGRMNDPGWMNFMLHMQAHQMALAPPPPPPGMAPPGPPGPHPPGPPGPPPPMNGAAPMPPMS